VDVILNFDTTDMWEDNILSQLHASGKQIVFYGDDTWLMIVMIGYIYLKSLFYWLKCLLHCTDEHL